MDLSFKLQNFEGPMDLLLHLIDKNKVDIMDIPIAEITDQYFACLNEMPERDMETMSDFLVMAATLLDIKARLLLPPEKDETGEEIDPRSELVERLLEYKMVRFLCGGLRILETDAEKMLFHKQDIPEEVKRYREPVDPDQLLKDVTLGRLHAVFADIMKRQEDRTDPIRSTFGQIEKEKIDSGEVMKSVQRRIMRKRTCTFRSLLSLHKGKMYAVVTFLSILELIKLGRVAAVQDENFGEIWITVKDEEKLEQTGVDPDGQ